MIYDIIPTVDITPLPKRDWFAILTGFKEATPQPKGPAFGPEKCHFCGKPWEYQSDQCTLKAVHERYSGTA